MRDLVSEAALKIDAAAFSQSWHPQRWAAELAKAEGFSRFLHDILQNCVKQFSLVHGACGIVC